MKVEHRSQRARISAQTSVGGWAATTGGRSDTTSCVASGHSSWIVGDSSSHNATANPTMQQAITVVLDDSDGDNVASNEESAKTAGASSVREKGPRKKPSKEGLKAKGRYKAALKICQRLEGMLNLSATDAERLAWAKDTVEQGRAHFASKEWCAPTDTKFANRVEEDMAKKRPSTVKSVGPSDKRPRYENTAAEQEKCNRNTQQETPNRNIQQEKYKRNTQHETHNRNNYQGNPNKNIQEEKYDTNIQEEKYNKNIKQPNRDTNNHQGTPNRNTQRKQYNRNTQQDPNVSQSITAAKVVANRQLIVALVDRSNPLGQMTQERWKTVEAKLLDAMFAKMAAEPGSQMPSFDGAGWLNGVKVLKCNNDSTLEWVKGAVKTLQGLWNGAALEIVDKKSIPTPPRAKVLIPRIVKPELALQLLQRQNPDVPTADWKVINVSKTGKDGQNYIIQINKTAEDILYGRFGKMAWGIGSVYLRLKKRHPADNNHNTLQTGEMEEELELKGSLETSLYPQI